MVKKAAQATPNHLLRRARLERGWTQQVVAERIGAPNDMMVTRWERGTAFPSAYYIERLCLLFEQKASDLGLIKASEAAPPAADLDSAPEPKSQQQAPVSLVPPDGSAFLLDPTIPEVLGSKQHLLGRDALLAQAQEHLFTPASTALYGLPGMGKTSLAVELSAHSEVRAHFRDGILWASLGPKPTVLNHLVRWARLLGVDPQDVEQTTSVEAWGRAVHTAIGARHFLLVIDDVWSVEDALDLYVGGVQSAHLLTTRLPQVAFAFANQNILPIPELEERDGVALLAHFVPRLVEQDDDAALDLVRTVGASPLALRLMGHYLASQAFTGQPRRLHAALALLRDAKKRLWITMPVSPGTRSPFLDVDTPLSLHAAIAVSDQQLSASAHAALCSLSVFPHKPNSFTEEAALAVSAQPIETLDTLWDAGLIESPAPSRYMLHQTIADYARTQEDVSAARQRFVRYMVQFIHTHVRAYECIEREMNTMLAAFNAAAEMQMDAELVQGVLACMPFLRVRGYYLLADHYLNRALLAASTRDDMSKQAAILRYLADVAEVRGEYEQAIGYCQQGLPLAQRLEEVTLVSALYATLGLVTLYRGDYSQAQEYLEEGLQLARQLGEEESMCLLLRRLGDVALQQADFTSAENHYQGALELAQQLGHQELTVPLLAALGRVMQEQAKYVEAERYCLEGLRLARQQGHREPLGLLLNLAGTLAYQQGDREQAKSYYLEALALARSIGNRAHICHVLSNLGAVAADQGDYTEAEAYLNEGVGLARQLENRTELPFLLTNLGTLLGLQEQYEQANACFQESVQVAQQQKLLRRLSSAWKEWGNIHLKYQHLDEASAAFQQVLALVASGESIPDHAAQATYGLAQVAAARGDIPEAIRLGEESLKTLLSLGHGKASEVRKWLQAVRNSSLSS
jgi:tetratricopeptide (TPR) repeat protein/transcriptional regulator with XRE-family HTH domain